MVYLIDGFYPVSDYHGCLELFEIYIDNLVISSEKVKTVNYKAGKVH